MPDPVYSADQMDMSGYAFMFGGKTLGWTKDVDPSGLKIETQEKKIGQIGDIVIDRVIKGLSGTVKATLHQVKIDVFRAVIPGAPATGPIPLVPGTQYTSMYSLAKLLTIHPVVNGVVTTEDINLLKAAVMSYKLPKSSNGTTWREIEIEFEPYPDQAQLLATPSVLVYGYIGAPPT